MTVDKLSTSKTKITKQVKSWQDIENGLAEIENYSFVASSLKQYIGKRPSKP